MCIIQKETVRTYMYCDPEGGHFEKSAHPPGNRREAGLYYKVSSVSFLFHLERVLNDGHYILERVTFTVSNNLALTSFTTERNACLSSATLSPATRS